MSDGEARPGDGEIDALKWYVGGMIVASVLIAGGAWWFQKKATELRASVESAKRSLDEMAAGKHEILAMLAAYKRNKEDEARDEPLTWFQARWKEVGIPDLFIQPDAWKYPADISDDNKYVEEKISLKFSSKNPLKREQIGRFLHNVEHSSSRLRILSLRVVRAGKDEALAEDSWTGQCEVGYRYPNVKD